MLFEQARVEVLISLSNEKYIFEGVHHAQKFCFLAFEKGGTAKEFPATFRINPREAVQPRDLANFIYTDSNFVRLSTALIKRLSPDSQSVMEFRSELDVQIAEKMLRFPLLGEEIKGTWNVGFTAELHMTNDSKLFKTEPGAGRLRAELDGLIAHLYGLTEAEFAHILILVRVQDEIAYYICRQWSCHSYAGS